MSSAEPQPPEGERPIESIEPPEASTLKAAWDLSDLWIGDCGCLHVLVQDECWCEPSWVGDGFMHRDRHTEERVNADGR